MTIDRSLKWLDEAMLHALAIVIACASSTFSSIYTPTSYQKVDNRNVRQNNDYHRQPYDSYINWWGSNQTDFDSTTFNFDPLNTKWINAPPFIQALEDFQETTKTVLSRIQSNSSRDDREKQKRYTIIVGVLDGMIKIMSRSMWQHYDQEYSARVPALFRRSQIAGYHVKAQLECVYRWAEKSIIRIKKIINNRWITYLHRVSDIPCNILILAIIDAVDDDDLKQEARVLMALGKASRLFLNKYAKVIDSVSNNRHSTLSTFITTSKDYFKPLIQAGSDTRKLLPSSLFCYDPPK